MNRNFYDFCTSARLLTKIGCVWSLWFQRQMNQTSIIYYSIVCGYLSPIHIYKYCLKFRKFQEMTSPQLMRTSSNDIRRGNVARNEQLAVAQTNMEMSMLNITYRDRKTNIWVREKTKVTEVIEQFRRWTWARNVSRIRDNRWTLCITTWKPYQR